MKYWFLLFLLVIPIVGADEPSCEDCYNVLSSSDPNPSFFSQCAERYGQRLGLIDQGFSIEQFCGEPEALERQEACASNSLEGPFPMNQFITGSPGDNYPDQGGFDSATVIDNVFYFTKDKMIYSYNPAENSWHTFDSLRVQDALRNAGVANPPESIDSMMYFDGTFVVTKGRSFWAVPGGDVQDIEEFLQENTHGFNNRFSTIDAMASDGDNFYFVSGSRLFIFNGIWDELLIKTLQSNCIGNIDAMAFKDNSFYMFKNDDYWIIHAPFINSMVSQGSSQQHLPEADEDIRPGPFLVGVNYHATSEDFHRTSFIREYHRPGVRETVISQLNEMANAGADVLDTGLWFVDEPGTESLQTWRLHFPPTQQELDNLVQYVSDVRDIGRLKLELTLRWGGCSDYRTIGSSSMNRLNVDDRLQLIQNSVQSGMDMNVGDCNIAFDDYTNRMTQTMFNILQALSDIEYDDGSKVVERIYYLPEVRVPLSPNDDLFLLMFSEFFIENANNFGITPSIFFHAEGGVQGVGFLSRDIYDLRWLTDTLDFMRQRNIPIPERIDFSFYPTQRPLNEDGSFDFSRIERPKPWEPVIRHFFDVLTETLPPGTKVAFAETFYPSADEERREFGRALINEAERRGMLDEVVFWSTPGFPASGNSYLGTPGYHLASGFPFDFMSFKNPGP